MRSKCTSFGQFGYVRCFFIAGLVIRGGLCLSPRAGLLETGAGRVETWRLLAFCSKPGARTELCLGAAIDTVANNVDSDDLTQHVGDEPGQHREKLILWRGERQAGYSREFRHCEFSNSLAAVSDGREQVPPLQFADALVYDAEEEFSSEQAELFGCAAQFVTTYDDDNGSSGVPLSTSQIVEATRRSSLVRDCYEVLAEGDSYEEIADAVVANGALEDVMVGGENEAATWRVRLRQYGSTSTSDHSRKVGKNVRSPIRAEKAAILAMEDLLIKLGGKVRLDDPECSLYALEGLKGRAKVLARMLANGPKTSTLAPKNRICVTTTPLEEVAAFSICNVARIREGQAVLDPYAGSCATLLAAASLAPACRTVGIEIAHDGMVNRDDIMLDFSTRDLTPPADIVRGSCASQAVRDLARAAIDGESFDVIVTDPPYGIRESTDIATEPPLDQLLTAIIEDRDTGVPLLKKGGRLVAFVPTAAGEDLQDNLPSHEQMEEAGLVLTEMKEQALNDSLSRWLVAFDCIR